MTMAANIQLMDLRNIDDVPRVKDLALAAALGFERPRKLRDMIKRSLAELRGYGEVCPMVGQTSEVGGRPTTEFWLNEQQALLLCMFSRTERAAEVRRQLIDVFTAWRAGRIGSAPADRSDDALDLPLYEMSIRLALLRECRLIHGPKAAARLWSQIGMPSVEAPASASVGGATDDPLARFLAACTVRDPGGPGVSARAMWERWCAFARDNGLAQRSETWFGRSLKSRLAQNSPTARVRIYLDVRLADPADARLAAMPAQQTVQ